MRYAGVNGGLQPLKITTEPPRPAITAGGGLNLGRHSGEQLSALRAQVAKLTEELEVIKTDRGELLELAGKVGTWAAAADKLTEARHLSKTDRAIVADRVELLADLLASSLVARAAMKAALRPAQVPSPQ
jgi:hypothetical protein